MDEAAVIEIITVSMWTAAKVAAPMLITALTVGLFMGLIQSVTQIQEQTLSFVPKFIATGAVMVLSGSWVMAEMVALTNQLFTIAGELVT